MVDFAASRHPDEHQIFHASCHGVYYALVFIFESSRRSEKISGCRCGLRYQHRQAVGKSEGRRFSASRSNLVFERIIYNVYHRFAMREDPKAQ